MAFSIQGIDFEGRVWAYLLEIDGRFTLIDAGIAGQAWRFESTLKASGFNVSDIDQIVLTHCHLDHVGTVAELQRLTEATTMAHRLDAPVIRGESPVPPAILSEAEQRLMEQLGEGLPEAPSARVDRELEDGDTVDIGGEALVVHVPGHTDGSIALYVPKYGLLFTGDAVASVGQRPIVGVFNVDPKRARESFRRLAELEYQTACCGHGPPIMSGAAALMRKVADSL
jgi:glyoxylase-like metal-dependent hydrolase (beta-lactamase superfamily II)